MLVSEDNIADYLSSVKVCLSIHKVEEIRSFRNKIFVVNDTLLLKNFKFTDEYNLKGFKNEAAFLKKQKPGEETIYPRFILADRYFPVLIMEYLKDYRKGAGKADVKAVLPLIGKYLWNTPGKGLKRDYPWIWNTGMLRQRFPEVDHTVVKRINSLKRSFKFDAVIHGDLKLDNILTDGRSYKVVDWEFCSLGDRVWDGAYLSGSLILADSDYAIFYDSITFKNVEWFFTLNEDKLLFIRDTFLFLRDDGVPAHKFICFLGLAMLQRLLESKVGEAKYYNYDFFMSLAQELILRPQSLEDFLNG